MGDAQPLRRVYSAHREKQRRHILATAQTLFDQHSLDRVTMTEITAASGLRVSTIYQYFSSKDEIIWALVEQLLERSQADMQRLLLEPPGSVLETLEMLFARMGEQLSAHPEQVRFMAQFDARYARDWSAEPLLALEARILAQPLAATLTTLGRTGIADGSLHPDLDPALALHSVVNAAIATQRRLASLGPHVEQEYGQPVERLFAEACRMLLHGLRAP